ncbi:MAG: carbohydrate ABC transporter permease, partial [Bacillota bacterium]|nr:carbohydrate ABC transporter permease [Bacillota bacterium]
MGRKIRNTSSLFWKAIIYFFVFSYAVSVILPFLNIISVSLSSSSSILQGQVTIYPQKLNFDAYLAVISNRALLRAYGNTLYVVTLGTASSLLMTMLAAYPLSKKSLPGVKWITFMITLTMWFSGGMIPLFLVVKNIGLYNTRFALFVPGLIAAFNVIVMRNFFESLPDSLEESARIDGAHDFTILFRIVVPLSKPVLATVTLWLAVGLWNSFFAPLLYLQDNTKYTLQLVLRDIILQNSAYEYGMDVLQQSERLDLISDSIRYATIMFSIV